MTNLTSAQFVMLTISFVVVMFSAINIFYIFSIKDADDLPIYLLLMLAISGFFFAVIVGMTCQYFGVG